MLAPEITTSTRRFCSRPAAVAFDAMGRAFPYPTATIASGRAPRAISAPAQPERAIPRAHRCRRSLPPVCSVPDRRQQQRHVAKPGVPVGPKVSFPDSNIESFTVTTRPRGVSRVTSVPFNCARSWARSCLCPVSEYAVRATGCTGGGGGSRVACWAALLMARS